MKIDFKQLTYHNKKCYLHLAFVPISNAFKLHSVYPELQCILFTDLQELLLHPGNSVHGHLKLIYSGFFKGSFHFIHILGYKT